MLLELFDLTILRFITFRAAAAAIFAFGLGIALGPAFIRALRRRKIGAEVEKGDSAALDALHRGKKGTPTMGGLLIVGAALAAVLLFGRLDAFFVRLSIFAIVALAAIGWVDDRAKLVSRGRGLRARPKLALEAALGIAVGLALHAHYEGIFERAEAYAVSADEAVARGDGVLAPAGAATAAAPRPANLVDGTALYVPFFKNVAIPLGFGFVLFAAFVIVATVNAVNLTDGIDGLAAGTSVFSLLVFTAVAYVVGRTDFSAYLLLPYVPGAGEAAVVGAAMLGATLAFLWYNTHPAELFMGDTGSLPLGGAIALLGLATKHELLIAIAGGVFVIEALSVLLQVAAFRLTGKRIFRIAPIHHHFEFAGIFETKVTTRLWIVAAILAVVALATLKVR